MGPAGDPNGTPSRVGLGDGGDGDDEEQDTIVLLMLEKCGCSVELSMMREPNPLQLSAQRKSDANATRNTTKQILE